MPHAETRRPAGPEFVKGLWRENPGLVQLLGLCPLLAVTSTFVNGLGLGIALMSYDGRLFWGFNADWDQLPDLHDFVIATITNPRQGKAIVRELQVDGRMPYSQLAPLVGLSEAATRQRGGMLGTIRAAQRTPFP